MQGFENARAFALADSAISNADYGTAQTLINNITLTNIIESNWKAVDNVLIKLQSDTLNNSDINSLQSIAAQCPMAGGKIVWQARALLNEQYNIIASYPGDCPTLNGEGARAANISSIKNTNLNQTITLYPNPNNGQMQIDYNITSDADLQILDINGNLVCTYTLKADAKNMNISNDKLSNGVYFYRMIKDNIALKCSKLVIIK